MNYRGFPPGCGDSVADFWGSDAHGVRLRCPDDVSGDMQEGEIPEGALRLNLITTQTMVTTGIFPARKNSHGRTEIRTRDLMISSQRPWPLGHEAEQTATISVTTQAFAFLTDLRYVTSLRH